MAAVRGVHAVTTAATTTRRGGGGGGGGARRGAGRGARMTTTSSRLSAVVDTSTVNETTSSSSVRASSQEGKVRPGMRRQFADERSLRTPEETSMLREFWYPATFESKFKENTSEIEFVLLDEEWVLSKSVNGEYKCAAKRNSSKTLATGTRDGMVMVWPGSCAPAEELPSHFAPPEGYTIHAELVIEDVPVEHGLLMENLLDLAHAPFTHTGTFAKGWGVPNMVRFASRKLRKEGDGWHDISNFLVNGRSEGSWKPYPIDMKFLAPCMVDSHIGLAQAGAVGKGAQFTEGVTAMECEKHLHQLHVCLPSTPGRTRLLYRMSLDFAYWAKYVPGIEYIWTEMANQVLGEDLRLVTGQQDRMQRGGRVWAHPVAYDKLGLVYRRWRNVAEGREVEECSVAE